MMKKILIVFLALAAAVSCKSQYDAMLASTDVDAKYQAAFDYFNDGKYQKAATLFESLSVSANGLPIQDTVMYYWGVSNYRFKDYYTASDNFAKFIETFPSSPFIIPARYQRIDCLYRQTLRYELDQANTYTCISAINEFQKDYPGNEYMSDCQAILLDLGDRLDRKAYENARLYYKMEDYKAARVALKNVLKDDYENNYREDILYYIAMSSYKYALLSIPSKQRERYLTFVDDYLNFVGEIPESPYTKELNVMYNRAQKALGRYTGVEAEEEELTDRDFEKERKTVVKAAKAEERAAKKLKRQEAAAAKAAEKQAE